MKKYFLLIFLITITVSSYVFAVDNLIIRGKVVGVYDNYFEVEVTKGSCKGNRKLYFDNSLNIPTSELINRFLYEEISVMVDTNVCKPEMKIIKNMKDKIMEK
jgi:hypothetical protein